MDYLQDIIDEQKKYDERVKDRLHRHYNLPSERLLAKTRCMIHEIIEVEREVKSSWAWWKKPEPPPDDITQRILIELIDVQKFLLSALLDYGIDSSEKFHTLYMFKHKIINERLDDLEKK